MMFKITYKAGNVAAGKWTMLTAHTVSRKSKLLGTTVRTELLLSGVNAG